VKDDDGAGGEIFCYEPADYQAGGLKGRAGRGAGMHWYPRIGRAELAGAGLRRRVGGRIFGPAEAVARRITPCDGRSMLRPYG